MSSHATNSQTAILEQILCPILHVPMKNPFQGSDGNTYEYDAIVTWLNKKQISPLTREPMYISDLNINVPMRSLCDKYHRGEFGDIEIKKTDSKVLNNADFDINDKTYINKTTNELFIKISSIGDEAFDMKSAPPMDIVCTVDRSGSTGNAVESQTQDGSKMEVGYSIRDLLVHGAKTIISSMRDCDRLCIIMFDNEIEIVVPLQQMNQLNRSTACAYVENYIKPRGTTNIYGSIKKGIEIIDERDDKTRNAAMMVLTDGQPNVSPARGELKALEKLQKETNFSSPIYTFGFGYNLKPGLLYGLSKIANASTGHIPDGGMVATVFSNYLAMIMSTACVNLELTLKAKSPVFNENSVIGDFPVIISDDKKELTIRGGTVQFQQSRDFAIHIDSRTSIEFSYVYEIGGKKFHSPIQISNAENGFQFANAFSKFEENESDYQRLRLWVSQQLRDAIYIKSVLPDQDSTISLYKNIISTIDQVNHPKATALLETVKNQVFMILGSNKKEHAGYYKKWGEFYLDLLSSGLLRQHTPNFKDEACKVFGGKCFKNFVDHIADTFDTLPPPEPSLKVYNTQTRSFQRGQGVASMSSYNNQSGGCWTGDSLVTMADGSKKRSDKIQSGDEIKTLTDFKNGNMFKTTTILKVIQTNLPSGDCLLVNFPNKMSGGITPWHPIIHEGGCVFPNQFELPSVKKCNSLFNFICSHTHFALVNETPCITLGHSYQTGILKHPYFGSKQVVKDLALLDGFEEGHVIIYPHWFHRGGPDLENRGRRTINKISPQ